MTVPSIQNPNFRAIDSSGNPLEGGKLYVFDPGQITNAKTTYTDTELTAGNENTHPIILDSKGECTLYYSGTARLRLFTSDDVLVDDWDNVASSGDINTEWVNSLTATFASSTSFTVAGDQTSIFHANRRIRASDSSTLYGTVSSSSYSNPNTTVNVTLDSGSLSASLTEVAVGIISATNTSLPGNSVSSAINSATAKTTPVDADVVGLVDSEASNVLKKLSWANIKATLKTYFDSVTTTLTNKTLTSPTINSGALSGTFTGSPTFVATTHSSVTSSAALPQYVFIETDATADNGRWDFVCVTEQFRFRILNDAANSAVDVMRVDRTGASTVDTVNFPNGTVSITTADIDGGNIDGTTIGASTAAAATVNSFLITNTQADKYMVATGAGADAKRWREVIDTSGNLIIQTRTDANGAGENLLIASRSGTTIGTVNFVSGTLQSGGVNVATISGTQTLSNKSIALGSNTVSGTMAQFDAACSDGNFVYESDIGTIASQNSNSVTITGGSITGITDLAVADGGTGASTAAGALTNFGLTATAAELNELDDSAQAITDYESGVRHYIFSGALGVGFTFDVDANITEGTFESIGPTGSGATNIWDRLDDIPDGATAVILNVIAGGVASAADTQIAIDVSGRKTGSTTSGTQALIASTYQVPGSTSSIQSFNTCFVPIDSSKRFDIRWDATGDASRSITLVLVGFLK